MKLQQRIRSMSVNAEGTDYFVGDLHGHFDLLQDMLDAVAFGPSDRLFSVGDLVDRGPRSWEALHWFGRSTNCHAVLGNHDALLLASFERESRVEAIRTWATMGNEWFVELSDEKRDVAREIAADLPLGMTIQLSGGRTIGLIHGGLLLNATWSSFVDFPEDRIEVTDCRGKDPNSSALWGRAHALAAIHASWASGFPLDLATRYAVYCALQSVVDVDLLVAGHTPLSGRQPLLAGNRVFIDTGVYQDDGLLTLIDPLGQRVFQASIESGRRGVQERPWPTPLDASPFQLSPDQLSELQAKNRSELMKTGGRRGDANNHDDVC